MRLKELTPDLVGELEKELMFLKNQQMKDVFLDSNFPHLNSTISGSIIDQFSPNWYTRIHDILEHKIVEYNRFDIEAGKFLDMKSVLLQDSLNVYLYPSASIHPVIQIELNTEVQDIERGTFKFLTPLVKKVTIGSQSIEVN